MDLCRVRFPAANADRLLAFFSYILVELDRELSRALENMKELTERQPQEREDHRDRVRDGQELIGVAFEPRIAHRQQESGDADSEEHEQRQKILLQVLES